MDTQTLIIPIQRIDPDHGAAGRYLAKLSSVGRVGMMSALKLAARVIGYTAPDEVPWNWLNADSVQQLIRAIADTPTESGNKRSPNSVATALNAIKGACKSAWLAGTLEGDTWERIREVKAPRGERLPAGRDMSYRELDKLMQVCIEDSSPAGYRDAAMLAVWMATGLRRAELATIKLADLNFDTGELVIIGKGDKQRQIYLAADALRAIQDWLAARGCAGTFLFNPINKGGNIVADQPMTTTALHLMLKKRGAEASVEVQTHNFRRSLAGNMLHEGIDLATVAAWMGHADVKTTAKYDRRGARAKQNAVSKIRIPYRR